MTADQRVLPAWPAPTLRAWAEGVYQVACQQLLDVGAHFPTFLIVDAGNGYNLLDVTQLFERDEGQVVAASLAKAMVVRLDAQAIAFIGEVWTRATLDGPRTGEKLMVVVEACDGEKVVCRGRILRTKTSRTIIDEEAITDPPDEGIFTNFFAKEV